MIVVGSRLATVGGAHWKRTSVTLAASTETYRMNAAFMRRERHERGIHVV
jgi:hypothetical protein